MKRYWEIIAGNLSKAGWSWGSVSAIDSNGQTISIADAQRGDGHRFILRADEKLKTAFMELEAAIRPLRQVVLTKQVAGPSQQTVNTHPVRKGGYLSAVVADCFTAPG